MTTWKNGEVEYCIKLVHRGGNKQVPAASVTSYLQLQMEDAVRDGAIEAAQELLNLLMNWRGSLPYRGR